MVEYLLGHPYETVVAFIFAIIAAILVERSYKLFSKLFNYLFPVLFSIFRKSFKKYFNKNWLILSDFYSVVPENMVEQAINRYYSLIGTYNKGYHCSDISDNYHLWRELKLVNLLSSADIFLDMMLRHLALKINPEEIDIVLYSVKPTNELFSKIFGANSFRDTSFQKLLYDETNGLHGTNSSVIYEDGEDLKGKKVILIEALHIFPGPLIKIIKEIKRQGGIIKKVIILFNGFYVRPSFSPWGVKDKDLLIAWDINLKCSTKNICSCDNPPEILSYNNY